MAKSIKNNQNTNMWGMIQHVLNSSIDKGAIMHTLIVQPRRDTKPHYADYINTY